MFIREEVITYDKLPFHCVVGKLLQKKGRNHAFSAIVPLGIASVNTLSSSPHPKRFGASAEQLMDECSGHK